MSMIHNVQPYLRINGITKKYGNNTVLNNMTLDINLGEVIGIVGENGAGKSTLIKILSGAISPTSGTMHIDGKSYEGFTPEKAGELGIHAIYQESILVPSMSIIDNIFVGHEIINKIGIVDKKQQYTRTAELMKLLNITLDPYKLIRDLDIAGQQYVKIMKALERNSRILIMDEPTTMFNDYDVRVVLETVKKLRSHGIGILFISHHLDEITEISDRIIVIRDGELINVYDNRNRDTEVSKLTTDMVGRAIDKFYRKERHGIGDTYLEIKNITIRPGAKPVSFEVRKGEILGIAGIVGAGRTELVRKIFGADKHDGKVIIGNREVDIHSPRQAINQGMAFITEDRQRSGLNLRMSILDNISLVDLGVSQIRWYNRKKGWKKAKPIYEKMKVKASSPLAEVRSLSGGNQQKVVLAKWILTRSDIIIFDEPTRGIDVNAKAEIYDIVSELAKEGKTIIMVSSDLPELISMSDRVLVMRDSTIVAEFQGEDVTEQNIIAKAIGV